MSRTDIRLALPSKGALHKDAFDFLEACGLKIFRPNPRQYEATIPSLPELTVIVMITGVTLSPLLLPAGVSTRRRPLLSRCVALGHIHVD